MLIKLSLVLRTRTLPRNPAQHRSHPHSSIHKRMVCLVYSPARIIVERSYRAQIYPCFGGEGTAVLSRIVSAVHTLCHKTQNKGSVGRKMTSWSSMIFAQEHENRQHKVRFFSKALCKKIQTPILPCRGFSLGDPAVCAARRGLSDGRRDIKDLALRPPLDLDPWRSLGVNICSCYLYPRTL